MQTRPAVIIKKAAAILLAIAAAVIMIVTVVKINKKAAVMSQIELPFIRDVEAMEEEDYDPEESTVCTTTFVSENGDYTMEVSLSYEEWEKMPAEVGRDGDVYILDDGRYVAFSHNEYRNEKGELDREAVDAAISSAVRDMNSDEYKEGYQIALALALMAISLCVMIFFGKRFSNYEQIWFLSIMALACVVSIIAPEEDLNGVQGIVIMALYLADTFLNILCELLISKQSKWNFIVSVAVELTEIAICLVLAYRFVTMATTLFFWLPIDIMSFVNWHKHPDRQKEEVTRVRKLSGWAEVAIIAGIVVWTVVLGGIMSKLDIATDLFGGNRTLATWVAYLDACASAVGIANGLFIFFRIREQWIAWYICAALEAIINVLSGQFVLLPLKLGYFTNTTYGYIKWTKYIKEHKEEKATLL
ncbi:MAG: nicotinamide mononucleotide transporter [Clostridia bacterium]|nr:nicotinamide mononucleotide transporter [Clostridia bacterium]